MNRVVFACDAGVDLGIGHVMRCLGLAEELRTRGCDCVFVADLGSVGWVKAQVVAHGFGTSPPGDAAAILALEPSTVVIDSYTLAPTVSIGIRAAGVPVLAIVDGATRGQSGDLYVDQNLGADDLPAPDGTPRLAGLDYVILRDAVLRARLARDPVRPDRRTLRVLAYFGGTDAAGAAPAVTSALIATDAALDMTVVAANAALARALWQIPVGDRQILTVIAPTSDLHRLAGNADLVSCAAGTSLWEMLCIGAPVAAVRVVDNQDEVYHRVLAAGAIAGLGHVEQVRRDPAAATATLLTLLRDEAARERLREVGRSMVDGRGRGRVADALLALRSTPVAA